MAHVEGVKLKIQRHDDRSVATVAITGKLVFSTIEQCMMKHCPEATHFDVWAKLLAAEHWKPGDSIYTWAPPKQYPGESPDLHFEAEIGYSQLNEDRGTEVYELRLPWIVHEIDTGKERPDELIGRIVVKNLYTDTARTYDSAAHQDVYV